MPMTREGLETGQQVTHDESGRTFVINARTKVKQGDVWVDGVLYFDPDSPEVPMPSYTRDAESFLQAFSVKQLGLVVDEADLS